MTRIIEGGATARGTGEAPGPPESPQASIGNAPGPAAPAPSRIRSGACYVMFAYDVGFSIDLDEAERRVKEATAREGLRHRRRAPRHFEFRPAPLRIIQPADPIRIGDRPGAGWATAAAVEYVLYDFGAVSVSYMIPLGDLGPGAPSPRAATAGAAPSSTSIPPTGVGPHDLDGLLALGDELYDNDALLADSRRRVEQLVAALGAAVTKPEVAEFVEDYVIYQIKQVETDDGGAPPPAPAAASLSDSPSASGAIPRFSAADWVDRHAHRLAQILRAETNELSSQEISDALAARASYSPDDVAVIDWNASILVMDDAEEVRATLEFVNVELLEVRYLDEVLDRALDRGYDALLRESRRGLLAWGSDGDGLARLARLQVDQAILFEGVNNALKLIGDQYLARVYRLAAQRLHLPEWDASILRKLQTVESIYQKVHDRQGTRRMELLEWIIIVLIAISILVMFVPGMGH